MSFSLPYLLTSLPFQQASSSAPNKSINVGGDRLAAKRSVQYLRVLGPLLIADLESLRRVEKPEPKAESVDDANNECNEVWVDLCQETKNTEKGGERHHRGRHFLLVTDIDRHTYEEDGGGLLVVAPSASATSDDDHHNDKEDFFAGTPWAVAASAEAGKPECCDDVKGDNLARSSPTKEEGKDGYEWLMDGLVLPLSQNIASLSNCLSEVEDKAEGLEREMEDQRKKLEAAQAEAEREVQLMIEVKISYRM